MASICHRCALRLRYAAQVAPARSFSSTATAQRGAMPTFTESSNPELNEILSTIRTKIFLPNYLEKQEKKMMFKPKYRQMLIDNPQTVSVGDEDFNLQPLDLQKDLPDRHATVKEALDIILDEESKDWHQLPALMQGLKEGVKTPLRKETMVRVVRKAVNADKIGIVLRCLETPERTGMTLKNDEVLKTLLSGLHDMAERYDWSEKATGKALRDANVVSKMLESEDHGSGRRLRENDPRTQPETLGLFLELAAVYAYRHAGANDSEGLIKAYAGRLMSCLERGHVQPQDLSLIRRQSSGSKPPTVSTPQWPFLSAVRVWHGLTLARKILGADMPKDKIAAEAVSNYETRINELVKELESEEVTPYGERALETWNSCIRD